MLIDEGLQKLPLLLDMRPIIGNLIILLECSLVEIDFVADIYFLLLWYVLAQQNEDFVLNLLQVIVVVILLLKVVPLLIVGLSNELSNLNLALNLILERLI